jgi:hypothetical protein
MRASDLAEYLNSELFLERPEPRQKDPAKADVTSDLMPATPAPPEPPQRAAETERAKFASDILHLVMSVFTGARWTTREEYKRASALRDRRDRYKGRKTRG